MHAVTSKDGTTIAYDREGGGPVVMEQNGQQKLLDADQRQQQQATSQAQYQQYCSGQ